MFRPIVRFGVVVPVVSVLLAATANATDTIRSIQVTGVGEVAAPPDMATLQVGVATDGETAAEALEKNSSLMRNVFDALKKMGIAEKDIQTSQLQIGPQYAQSRNRTNELIGYRAHNQVRIVVRDLASLGSVVDNVTRSGANQFSGIGFGIDDERGVADQARNRALQEARRRAELYAQVAGVRVGKVMTIRELSSGGGPSPMMRGRAMMAADTPIATGEERVGVRVEVVYELVD